MTHYSPKQAAAALGVSESSVKRWCDLGAVQVLRTAGGHRRIPRQSVEKLLAGGIPRVEIDVEGAVGDESSSTPHDSGPLCPKVIRARFAAALRVGDERECRDLVNRLVRDGFSRARAADFLITEAMHHFGHQWQRGELDIYQERRACGICLGLIHELRHSIAISPVGPVAIGGSARGDIYQLPSELVELALAEGGWQATSLGCNLPLSTLKVAVQEYQPRLLWISLSAVEDEEALVAEFNDLADSMPSEAALIIGGRAATDGLRPRLRYTAHCDNLQQLTELARTLVKIR